jgi:hypothetical protein
MRKEHLKQTETPGRIDMRNIIRSIGQAKDLEDLLPLVDRLSRKTSDIMSEKDLSEGDIWQIALPLTKMRFLLTTIASRVHRAGDADRHDAGVVDLIDRCRDIEGRLKELRNDLARADRSRTP